MTLYYASDMVPCENAGYELILLKWESPSYLTIVFWFHVRAIQETPQGLRFILSPTIHLVLNFVETLRTYASVVIAFVITLS